MKILLAYTSAGSGHFKAATALYGYIKKHCPQIDLGLIDILGLSGPLFRFFYSGGYSFLIRHLGFLWHLFFWVTNFKLLRPLVKLITSSLNALNTQEFIKLLIQENPDFIISTHFLPAEVSSRLKKAKKIKAKLITIITDFGVHPFWLADTTDIYVVASAFTKRQLLLEGIAEDRIKEFGMPTDENFLAKYDRRAVARKFDIEADKFTVLIMTGSFGLGPLEAIVNALYKDVQILVVCATNKKLYAKLKKRELSGVKVFGFVDNVNELMTVSDIIITKAGGLTISEILNMELVPIFISSIPGQEECNAQVLKGYGIGFISESVRDIKNTVLDLKAHQYKIQSIKDNIKEIKKPDALREICNVVCQGSLGFSC